MIKPTHIKLMISHVSVFSIAFVTLCYLFINVTCDILPRYFTSLVITAFPMGFCKPYRYETDLTFASWFDLFLLIAFLMNIGWWTFKRALLWIWEARLWIVPYYALMYSITWKELQCWYSLWTNYLFPFFLLY